MFVVWGLSSCLASHSSLTQRKVCCKGLISNGGLYTYGTGVRSLDGTFHNFFWIGYTIYVPARTETLPLFGC